MAQGSCCSGPEAFSQEGRSAILAAQSDETAGSLPESRVLPEAEHASFDRDHPTRDCLCGRTAPACRAPKRVRERSQGASSRACGGTPDRSPSRTRRAVEVAVPRQPDRDARTGGKVAPEKRHRRIRRTARGRTRQEPEIIVLSGQLRTMSLEDAMFTVAHELAHVYQAHRRSTGALERNTSAGKTTKCRRPIASRLRPSRQPRWLSTG